MGLAITRSSKADTLNGVTAGKSYPIQGYTDGNAIVLTDDGRLITVAYGAITADGEWSVDAGQDSQEKAKATQTDLLKAQAYDQQTAAAADKTAAAAASSDTSTTK